MAREAVYPRVVLALHQIVLVLHARVFSMMVCACDMRRLA
jgi:hypothetical protein